MEDFDTLNPKDKIKQRKSIQSDEQMKPSYNFSMAERGKFHREDAKFSFPITPNIKPDRATVFIEKLDELCNLIEKSDDSLYAHLTINQIIQALQNIRNEFSQTGSFDKEKLDFLLAPTGAIQEVSINSGWEEKFLQLAKEIETELDNE